MAELTFKSPGVSTREIDLSGPTALSPSGTPAGVIGTSIRGPAFVPITIPTFQDFISKFGNSDGEKFGPLAMREWLANARSGTYIRLLGVGDGKQRQSDGSVNRAGFTVGNRLPQANGLLGNNAFANNGNRGPEGRTYFLGCFMSQSNRSEFKDIAGRDKNGYLTSAGLFGSGTVAGADGLKRVTPLIRGILMVPSGVIAALSCSDGRVAAGNTVVDRGAFGVFANNGSKDAGSGMGSIKSAGGAREFQLLLNGHKPGKLFPNQIQASFDVDSPAYFAKQFNTDPSLIEQAGHYLYAHFDVRKEFAVVTSSMSKVGRREGRRFHDGAFLLTGSAGRASGIASTASTIGIPAFEDWRDRFSTARSPFVVTQDFGGSPKNMFRFHALDDGAVGAGAYKITIENIKASDNSSQEYGKFDVLVRKLDDTDKEPIVLEAFRGMSIDPSSPRYIAKAIGDYHTYYDFDKKTGGQKLVIDGVYPNVSSFIRIEQAPSLRDGALDKKALPMGFRGIQHLVTSGSTARGGGILEGFGASVDGRNVVAHNVVQPPIPMRDHVAQGTGTNRRADADLTWGIQFEVKPNPAKPNSGKKIDASVLSHIKYYPGFRTNVPAMAVDNNEGEQDVAGCILDADRFNNNFFSLEKIQVIQNATTKKPVKNQWAVAEYRRNGLVRDTAVDIDGEANSNWRLVKPVDFKDSTASKFLKFTFPLQGGFDGVNIFDRNKSKFTDLAVRNEMADSAQGLTQGPTVSSIRKAIDVMEERTSADIQLLAIPGLRHEAIVDYAIESVERRFDAMLLVDVEEYDSNDIIVTGSNVPVSVRNTVGKFVGRDLDSSFAAAYAPDVIVTDPATNSNLKCPPTVVALGAMSQNDSLKDPWFAPAGYDRATLSRVVEVNTKLNRANLDDLYEAKINPITTFPEYPNDVVIFGQKTLQAAQTALDRVNVRRLLIDVRRKVRKVANRLLFEPNRAETLARFSASVNPILASIQARQGLSNFKVTIDASTTTQADVENNTIRGKIYLQPVRSLEFISLDFVVANAGAQL